MILGLSITNLGKVLKLVENTDSISLKYNQQDPSKLKIVFFSEKKDRVTEFNLNLIEVDSQ